MRDDLFLFHSRGPDFYAFLGFKTVSGQSLISVGRLTVRESWDFADEKGLGNSCGEVGRWDFVGLWRAATSRIRKVWENISQTIVERWGEVGPWAAG